MAGTPILDNIETTIASLISGMTTVALYNFNWSVVNQEDDAIGDFPRAIIDPRDSQADKITNMDVITGISSNDYTNEVLFTILVTGDLVVFDDNAAFGIRSVLRKALDDLLMLFGVNNQLNGYCDNILFVGSQIEAVRTGDITSPANLRSLWKVIYSQDRKVPTQYASS